VSIQRLQNLQLELSVDRAFAAPEHMHHS